MAGLLFLISLVLTPAPLDSLLWVWHRGAPPERFLHHWHPAWAAEPGLQLLALRWSWEISRGDGDAARHTLRQVLSGPLPVNPPRFLEEPLQDFFRAFRFRWPADSLRHWLHQIPPGERGVWWLYEEAWQLARQGHLDSAALLWTTVVRQAPASPYARWLVRHQDSLLHLTPGERGDLLYRLGRYQEALPLLRQDLSSGRRVRAYLTTLYRLRQNRTFLQEYRRLQHRLSAEDRHPLEYRRAVVLDRMGRKVEALEALVHLAQKSPRWRASAVTYASLLALETHRITWTARLLERALPGDPVARARAALLHLVVGRESAARRLFQENLKARGFWRAQALYFLHRLTGNPALAETLWREFPLSYYTARLSRPPVALRTPPVALPGDSCPPVESFRALARYFLDDQAEATDFARRCPLQAARVADSVGNPALTVRLIQRWFGTREPTDSLTLALLFPLPEAWRRVLASLNLPDPWLFMAILREESHFRPFVVSPAGAIGLAQVMPATYRALFGNGSEGTLFVPRENLRAGAAVLQRELTTFGVPALAVAAYNAGPNRVKAWMRLWQRLGILQEEDLWVEFIPFRETRRYVRRVYRSWRLYRWLYPRAF